MADFLSCLSLLSQPLHSSNDVSDRDYDCHARDLITYLRQSLSDKTFNNTYDHESLLDNIDPSLNSVSYLIILHSQVQSIQARANEQFPREIRPSGRLWLRAMHFLGSFDRVQVRYAGQEWRYIVELVGRAAQAVSKPLLAIQPIRNAMLRLDPSSAVFTSTHVLLVKLCLHAREYSCVLPILENQICHFPSDIGQAYLNHHQPLLCAQDESDTSFIIGASGLSAKITYEDHLQYFLYGAMVYMALKEWNKALHFLSIIISSPVVNSISMIMVEAYKKWILASLLGEGKLITPPGIITSHVVKVYRSLSRPYIALAHAFECGDFQKLKAEYETAQSIWHMDHNTGLVFQVLDAYHRFAIVKLGKTFAAITMADVTTRMPSHHITTEEMEAFIASLIMSEALGATLLHSSGNDGSTMLRFSGPFLKSNLLQENNLQAQLMQGRHALKGIASHIRESSHGLNLSNEHMESIQKNQKRADGVFKGGFGLENESGGFDVDEDIMGDVC